MMSTLTTTVYRPGKGQLEVRLRGAIHDVMEALIRGLSQAELDHLREDMQAKLDQAKARLQVVQGQP